jgi:hypothetical protein
MDSDIGDCGSSPAPLALSSAISAFPGGGAYVFEPAQFGLA